MKSGLFKLDWKDLLNGFFTAVIGAIATQLLQTLSPTVEGQLPSLPTLLELKNSALFGLASGLADLLKRLISNDNGDILKKSTNASNEPSTP